MTVNYKNIAQAKSIEQKNKERLLKLNPQLNEESGIYFWTRTDENGVRHAYVGQALHILTRNAQHLSGYQYIDLSIKAHKLYDESENPCGYKLNFINFPEEELNDKERYYITLYAKQGYQMKNRDTGGGAGKQEIGERKAPKGYYDGVVQGRKTLARELSDIISKHLTVSIRADKDNKKGQRALEKFWILLKGEQDGHGK